MNNLEFLKFVFRDHVDEYKQQKTNKGKIIVIIITSLVAICGTLMMPLIIPGYLMLVAIERLFKSTGLYPKNTVEVDDS